MLIVINYRPMTQLYSIQKILLCMKRIGYTQCTIWKRWRHQKQENGLIALSTLQVLYRPEYNVHMCLNNSVRTYK